MINKQSLIAGRRIVIVGGGFSGAIFAVQLARRARAAVHISIIEPREHIGHGLAYSTVDPDHRLNGPLHAHVIDPDHPEELLRWCEATGLSKRDPQATVQSGHLFLRRSDIGVYLSEQVALHAHSGKFGSTIRHVRDTAVDVVFKDESLLVVTSTHGSLIADLVVLATGNPPPSLRKPFKPEHAHNPRIIRDPLHAGCLDSISVNAEVLIVGSGLTALDVLSTLLRRGHQGKLTVVSRRGLRPREQSPEIRGSRTPRKPSGSIAEMMNAPIPEFIAREPVSVRRWCRALRMEIERVERAGGSWHEPFDAVRDAAGKLWYQLSLSDKLRFVRRLRIFYDVHRFRTPPRNEQLVRQAEQEGRVRYLAASIKEVVTGQDRESVEVELSEKSAMYDKQQWTFDYVINCTGLESVTPSASNPLLVALEKSGMIRKHDTGLGYDVSANCEAIDVGGRAEPLLRVIGPPTAGVFGDPLGAVYISMQISRILPDVMRVLADET